ncbi:MAG: HemK/PrmC family methyltransferase [Candidatus Absconditabacterales bacterium]
MKLSELLGREDLKEKFVLQKFLCTFLSCSREELWTDMDKELSDEIIQKILTAYKSYVEDKKPLEYILGHVDFFGREFFVNEATLIPRPETEYMITAVTEFISMKREAGSMKHHDNVLLDIGTGCGVLGISVLLQNPGYFSEVVFSDYFENALEIAKRNFQGLVSSNEGREKKYVQKVQFLHSDLLDFLNDKSLNKANLAGTNPPGFDFAQPSPLNPGLPRAGREVFSGNIILVANLPYIPEETFEANAADNVKKWEPKPAFVGGDDGLDYYRIMLDQIISLKPKAESRKPETFVMFLEMMTWQVDILRQLYDDVFVFEEVKTFHFNIRIVKCWLR